MSFRHLGTVQHCFSAIKRVCSFTDCILILLNVNDDDDDDTQITIIIKHPLSKAFVLYIRSLYYVNLTWILHVLSTLLLLLLMGINDNLIAWHCYELRLTQNLNENQINN